MQHSGKWYQCICVAQGTSVEPKQKSRKGSPFSLYFALIIFTEHEQYDTLSK